MLRYIQLLALLTAVAVAATANAQSTVDGYPTVCAACCSCGSTCDCNGCCEACCATMEEVIEEGSCWKVRCEKICVPAIRLPWEPGGSGLTLFNCLRNYLKGNDCSTACAECGATADCCDQCCARDVCRECAPRKCGCVRCVRVLEKEKYEVTKCQCKWEIQCLPTCGDCGTDACCEQIGIDRGQHSP